MSSEKHACSADVPSYTVDEIESVTSEFIVKNVVSVSKWRVSPEAFVRVSWLPPVARGFPAAEFWASGSELKP